jgi:hypothetical protein
MSELTDLTIIKRDESGTFHSPYSAYNTRQINNMQAHLYRRYGEAWLKQGDALVIYHPEQSVIHEEEE